MIDSDTGFHIFMGVLLLYFVGQLAWSIRSIAKLPKQPKGPKRDNRDFRLLWSTFRAARRTGASFTDSIRSADEAVVEFNRTGNIPEFRLAEPLPEEKAPPRSVASRTIGLAQAVFINAVTLLGVFNMHWPIGTALALYWTETVFTTFSIGLLMLIWRYTRRPEQRGPVGGEALLAAVIFTAAHFVFLFFFLAVILPRYSEPERFDRISFERGLTYIAIILAIDFAANAITIAGKTSSDVSRYANTFMGRVGVMHLTIIFGMFALAIFGNVRAFFGVFAGLKALIDVTRRL